MTVSVNSRRREYVGNGVTTSFNGPMAFVPSHIAVYTSVGGEMVILSPANYTVNRLGNPNGTRVVMNTAPANGVNLLLLRVMPYSQETDITNQSAFFPETLENGMDSIVMQVQQLADRQDLTFRYSETYVGVPPSLILPPAEAGKAIGWNAGATGLRNITLEGAGDLTLRDDLEDPTAGAGLVSFRQLGTGAVTQSVLEELRRVVRPEHFGAVGDGVTDDQPAFVRAAAYILSLPAGGVISCTPGKKYAFAQRWSVIKSAGKQFRVDMNGCTFTKTGAGWSGAIMYYGSPTEVAGEHLVLKGPGVFQGVGAAGTGLYLEWAGGSEIDGSVSFRNFVNGLFLVNTFAMRVSNKCSFLYCSTGGIVCNTICHHLVVDGCGFYVNQRDIYFVAGAPAYNLAVMNCDLEGSLAAGANAIVLDAGGASINIQGNYIEGKSGSPLVFGSAGVEALAVQANWIGYNTGTQAWINVNSGYLDGNIFWDQQQALASTVKDFDIGANSFNGTSNRIYTPWQTPTLLNGFTSTGGTWAGNVAGFRKDRNGVVHLRGMVQASADGVVFTLPVGYRPAGLTAFMGPSANGGKTDFSRVQISGGGSVTAFRGTDTSAELSGVSYTAQQ